MFNISICGLILFYEASVIVTESFAVFWESEFQSSPERNVLFGAFSFEKSDSRGLCFSSS